MTVTESQRETIRRIAAQHGGESPMLFGSRARGDASDDSDLDLIVTLAKDRSLLDLIAIKQDLEDALGIPVDVLTPNSISPFMRDQILAEAVPA